MALNPLPAPEEKRLVVEAMFDRIAARYDAMNRLMTGGLDQRWRRIALDAAGVGAGDLVVDVACGTGDLAHGAAARGARVVGVDFAREMLRGAEQRGRLASFVRADAEGIPLPDGRASVVTCGFALRNFVDLASALREMGRVLAPGGRLAVLEVDRPDLRPIAAVHSLYFDRIVPRLGGWLSDRAAYRYLPSSTSYLPEPRELDAMLRGAGFHDVVRRRFLFGSAQLLIATRAPGGPAAA